MVFFAEMINVKIIIIIIKIIVIIIIIIKIIIIKIIIAKIIIIKIIIAKIIIIKMMIAKIIMIISAIMIINILGVAILMSFFNFLIIFLPNPIFLNYSDYHQFFLLIYFNFFVCLIKK